MRVLVCGDRHWTDREFLYKILNALDEQLDIDYIIEGGANGADKMAGDWAVDESQHALIEMYPAQWKLYGRSAGPRRNRQMLKEGKPNLVVAFHDDIEHSKGTKDMLKAAKQAGIDTMLYGH